MRLSVLGFLKIRFIGVLLSEESDRKTRPNYAGSLYIVIWMGGAKLSRPGIIRKPEYCRKVCHPMRLVIPSFSATGRMSRRISCCPQYGFFPPLLGLANTQCCASL